MAEGRKQYRVTVADICDVPPRRTSALDLYGMRTGIQKKSTDRLVLAKVTTLAKKRKFVENAIARPVPAWKALDILFMLCNCRKALHWRKAHVDQADLWLSAFLTFLPTLQHPILLESAKSQAPGKSVAFFHPDAIPLVADDIAGGLMVAGEIKKGREKAVAAAIVRKLRKDADAYRERLVSWIRQRDMFFDVYVREWQSRSAEGVTVSHIMTTIYPRRPLEPARRPSDGEREPTHSEYLDGITRFVFEKRDPKRKLVPISYEEQWVNAFQTSI